MRRNILMLLMLCISLCISWNANAGAYVKALSRVGDNITQQIVAWTEEDTAPNPCYGTSTCYIGPDVQYSSHQPGLYGTCKISDNCIDIHSYKTAKEVMVAYNKQHPLPYTAAFGIEHEGATCVGLFYLEQTPDVTEHNGILWPNSVCGVVPPSDQSCNLTIPASLDFGTLNTWQIDGQKRQITGTIKCSLATTLLVTATSTNNQHADRVNFTASGSKDLIDTMWGTPEINDVDAFTGADIAITGNNAVDNYNFSVTLKSNGRIEAGDYSGTEIIIASFE